MEYKKTFNFGKVAYNGEAKRNLVELEVTLKIEGKKAIFTASGGVWNNTHTDYLTCGQCIDDVYNEFKGQLQNRKQYEAIMALWEKWHLNDMKAGCKHQELKGGKFAVSEKCKTCGYGYGTAWNYEAIVMRDLNEIMRLLDIEPSEQLKIKRQLYI